MTSHILLPAARRRAPGDASRAASSRAAARRAGLHGRRSCRDALDMAGASGDDRHPRGRRARARRRLRPALHRHREHRRRSWREIEAAHRRRRRRRAARRPSASARRPPRCASSARDSTRPSAAADAGRGRPPSTSTVAIRRVVRRRRRRSASGSTPACAHEHVVRIDTEANIAVGDVAVGSVRAAGRHPAPSALAVGTSHGPLSAASASCPRSPGPCIVVGKDIHRHAFAREAIDALRANGGDVLVVDMGWPVRRSRLRRHRDLRRLAPARRAPCSPLPRGGEAAHETRNRHRRHQDRRHRDGRRRATQRAAVRMPTGFGAGAVIETAVDAVRQVAALSGITRGSLRSIGIGIPGAVDSAHRTGAATPSTWASRTSSSARRSATASASPCRSRTT